MMKKRKNRTLIKWRSRRRLKDIDWDKYAFIYRHGCACIHLDTLYSSFSSLHSVTWFDSRHRLIRMLNKLLMTRTNWRDMNFWEGRILGVGFAFLPRPLDFKEVYSAASQPTIDALVRVWQTKTASLSQTYRERGTYRKQRDWETKIERQIGRGKRDTETLQQRVIKLY